MKPSICALATLLAALLAPSESSAIILYGKGNEANQTDPGNGSPWTHVARMTNSTGSAVTTGSAVYLGNRFMLTANHVDPNNSRSHVTFDGTQNLAIEAGSQQQVATNLDLKVFRLSEDPGLPAMMLYAGAGDDDLSRSTTQVGWGVGRDPTVAPGTDTVPWGNSSTVAKRWGTNTTLGAPTNVSYTDSFGHSYSYEALETVLQNNASADEAAMTLYDSGGALFQLIGGDWYLSGIATLVDDSGDSVFGNAGLLPLGRGESNFFARISTYNEEINAVIPEPSAWAALLGIGSLLTVTSMRLMGRKEKKSA